MRSSISLPSPFTILLFLLTLTTISHLTFAARPNQNHHNAGRIPMTPQRRNAFGAPPNYDSHDRNSNPHASSSSSSASSTVVPLASSTVTPPSADQTIDCQQPLASFIITHAAITECPTCGGGGGANKENLTVTIENPAASGADIACHVSWDTSAASSSKFPIASQMQCDKDAENQLNAVVEKQASGVAAGFYLFVWNNNQMETMAAWMVRNITHTSQDGPGWWNGTNGMYQCLYFNGGASLDSMPAMVLSDFLTGPRSSQGNFSAFDP